MLGESGWLSDFGLVLEGEETKVVPSSQSGIQGSRRVSWYELALMDEQGPHDISQRVGNLHRFPVQSPGSVAG